MVKNKLELLANVDNIFRFPQVTIDSYKKTDEDIQKIHDILKVFLPKVESHFMYPIIESSLKNNFNHFNFVSMKEYPLPASFNISTKRIIMNMDIFEKREILNIHPQDIYATMCYSYVCAYYTIKSIDERVQYNICDYMTAIFIKLFGKKYGLIGSYTEEIPKLRFLVSYYILLSFFSLSKKEAASISSNLSGTTLEDIQIDTNDYNFLSIKSFIKCLSDSGVFHGLNIYQFATTIIKSFGVLTLALFEDQMRFMSTLVATSTGTTTIYPVYFQRFSPKLYQSIISTIEKQLL